MASSGPGKELKSEMVYKDEDSFFAEEDYDQPDFSALSALGLQRTIDQKAAVQIKKETNIHLNRRGMPIRNRKKNKIYFDDDHVSSYPLTELRSPRSSPLKNSAPRKTTQPTQLETSLFLPPSPSPVPSSSTQKKSAFTNNPASSSSISSPEKKVAQLNGYRLRNFLKLPQAHKWVFYEWFLSNIDKPLFEGANDFQIVLKEAFPQMMTRKLCRREWGFVRRLMGKPRRCSQAFFNEERQSLSKRREVLRLLQQRKITDISTLKDLPLPEFIPMQLVVGTKVTARLRKPENGLYTGVIDAVDTLNNTYRISFDRPGIGTYSIPDIEVLSNESAEFMPLSAFSHHFRPRIDTGLVTPPRAVAPKTENHLDSTVMSSYSSSSLIQGSPCPSLHNDPILAQSPSRPQKLSLEDKIEGYPVSSLCQIVTLSKILTAKKDKIGQLRDMNAQAESLRSYGKEVTLDFQRKYAGLVLEMDAINRELNNTLVEVQAFCQEIAPDAGMPCPTLLPSQIRERCYEEAAAIVDVRNHTYGSAQVERARTMDLITHLTSIMLQLKHLMENEISAFELTSLKESLNEIQRGLDPSNHLPFQNKVEVHLSHVMSRISQTGTLQAFNGLADR